MLAGCATSSKSTLQVPPPDMPDATAYNIAPKQMVQAVRDAVAGDPLNLGIAEESDGTILTDFKTYPGDWHILRRWQERTRYQIRVIPDWDAPAARSRLEVRAETEQRAADGQNWRPAPELDRSDRAVEVLRMIQQKLNSTATRAD
jgi:hypothetical protein